MYMYIYISTYTRVRDFGFFRFPGAWIRTLRTSGGPGTGAPSTGSGIPAMFEAKIDDKSLCDRLFSLMIASKSS